MFARAVRCGLPLSTQFQSASHMRAAGQQRQQPRRATLASADCSVSQRRLATDSSGFLSRAELERRVALARAGTPVGADEWHAASAHAHIKTAEFAPDDVDDVRDALRAKGFWATKCNTFKVLNVREKKP